MRNSNPGPSDIHAGTARPTTGGTLEGQNLLLADRQPSKVGGCRPTAPLPLHRGGESCQLLGRDDSNGSSTTELHIPNQARDGKAPVSWFPTEAHRFGIRGPGEELTQK